MRILHLTGDWKWTGSAAPMLELALAQRARGCQVALVCPAPPEGSSASLLGHARAAGLEPALTLSRGRGASAWRDAGDLRRLRALLADRPVDVIHAWHTRDHVLALRAAARARRAGLTRVVRSYPAAGPIPNRPWNRWLFGRGSDGLLCVSPGSAGQNRALRRGRPIAGTFGAVDLARFRPGPPDADLRASLGLAAEHRVVGIAARVQRHRRFDLLLAAFARLASVDERARLLVVGRGTHIQSTAIAPAERLGLRERVVFAGYRDGDYPDVLRSFDVATLLVPGSDGGCRALLESAASGIPAVTSRRGALPEIVVHGETGLVVDEEPEPLAEAWGALLADPERRLRMGASARRRAEASFAPARFAETVEALYREALGRA